MSSEQHREIWVETPDGQSMCALINGDMGWIMYLRYHGDAGFSSRNRAYQGDESATIDYVLSNGQGDRYPAAWALPIATVEQALDYFRQNGKPAPFVAWHNDSGDGAEIEFLP
jgi:hypothetical protein